MARVAQDFIFVERYWNFGGGGHKSSLKRFFPGIQPTSARMRSQQQEGRRQQQRFVATEFKLGKFLVRPRLRRWMAQLKCYHHRSARLLLSACSECLRR